MVRYKINPLDPTGLSPIEDKVIATSGGGGGGGPSTSISVTGEPKLTGDVTLSAGPNVVLTQTGQDIEIESTATGLPAGGTEGQILSKIDATDYNVQWIDNFASSTRHLVKASESITKGMAVYVSGASGTNMLVSRASNDSEAKSSKVLGLSQSTLATNDQGYVVTEGLIANIDTSTAGAVGDAVWLGVNGDLLYGASNKPVAPANLVYLGVVTRKSATVGEIFVNVENGFEIEELHNVLITSLADKNIIYYDNATGLWKNASVSTVLGYTPEDVANKSITTTLGTSNTLYPTQNAVKSYVDTTVGNYVPYTGATADVDLAARKLKVGENNGAGYVVGNDGTTERGSHVYVKGGNATAGNKDGGSVFIQGGTKSGTGTPGTATMFSKEMVALYTDNVYLEMREADKSVFIASDTGTSYGVNLKTPTTAYRTATFPDKNGTIAMTSDIPSVSSYVAGPASAVSNNVALFDGTTGKLIKDSGLTLSGTNTGDETQSTIKTKLGAATTSVDGYLTSTDWNTFNGKQAALGFTPENVANKSTTTTLGTSDTLYPSQKAVKTYVDNQATTQSLVRNEVPSGTINGTNVTFTLASTPAAGSERLHKNGIRLKSGAGNDYTISGSTITFATAPALGSILLADYEVSNSAFNVGTNSLISDEVPTGSVNGTNKVFTTARAYVGATLEVFINGVKQRRTADFVETTPSSGTFTMDEAPLTGDVIFVNYSYNLNPSSNADTVDGINASTTATANTLMPLDANARIASSLLDVNSTQAIGGTGSSFSSSSTSYVDVTGLSGTVTVPTGCTKMLVVGSIRAQSNATGTYDIFTKVLFGSTSSLEATFTSTAQYAGASIALLDVLTVSAGSYTAKVQMKAGSATSTTINPANSKIMFIPIGA